MLCKHRHLRALQASSACGPAWLAGWLTLADCYRCSGPAIPIPIDALAHTVSHEMGHTLGKWLQRAFPCQRSGHDAALTTRCLPHVLCAGLRHDGYTYRNSSSGEVVRVEYAGGTPAWSPIMGSTEFLGGFVTVRPLPAAVCSAHHCPACVAHAQALLCIMHLLMHAPSVAWPPPPASKQWSDMVGYPPVPGYIATTNPQDDLAIISRALVPLPDEDGNTANNSVSNDWFTPAFPPIQLDCPDGTDLCGLPDPENPTIVRRLYNAVINNGNDLDFFSFEARAPGTVTVWLAVVGQFNNGARWYHRTNLRANTAFVDTRVTMGVKDPVNFNTTVQRMTGVLPQNSEWACAQRARLGLLGLASPGPALSRAAASAVALPLHHPRQSTTRQPSPLLSPLTAP